VIDPLFVIVLVVTKENHQFFSRLVAKIYRLEQACLMVTSLQTPKMLSYFIKLGL
jgi:hypothetical protein